MNLAVADLRHAVADIHYGINSNHRVIAVDVGRIILQTCGIYRIVLDNDAVAQVCRLYASSPTARHTHREHQNKDKPLQQSPCDRKS